MVTLDPRSARQLSLIAEVGSVAGRLGIEMWLRGGWAMDFAVGQVTRTHEDIDFFVWGQDAERLANELGNQGYAPRLGAPRDQQIDFEKDGEELSFALLAEDSEGRVVVAGGPSAGAAWPAGTLEGPARELGAVIHRVISVESQIEIKEMMPTWVAGRPRRRKDREDIDRLRALCRDP